MTSSNTSQNPPPMNLRRMLETMSVNSAKHAESTATAKTNALSTESNGEFDIDSLKIIPRKKPSTLPEFLLVANIPDDNEYYFAAAASLFRRSPFSVSEEQLKHTVMDAALNFSRVFLVLVGMADKIIMSTNCENRTAVINGRTDVNIDMQTTIGGPKVTIGVVDLKCWQTAYRVAWQQFPRDLNLVTPTNDEPQHRVLRRLCAYATPVDRKHVAITGPPFIFTFGRLVPLSGPIYTELLLYGNSCRGYDRIKPRHRLPDHREWYEWYSALALFVLYGLFIHIPEFQQSLRLWLIEQGQEEVWKTLESQINSHFLNGEA